MYLVTRDIHTLFLAHRHRKSLFKKRKKSPNNHPYKKKKRKEKQNIKIEISKSFRSPVLCMVHYCGTGFFLCLKKKKKRHRGNTNHTDNKILPPPQQEKICVIHYHSPLPQSWCLETYQTIAAWKEGGGKIIIKESQKQNQKIFINVSRLLNGKPVIKYWLIGVLSNTRS